MGCQKGCEMLKHHAGGAPLFLSLIAVGTVLITSVWASKSYASEAFDVVLLGDSLTFSGSWDELLDVRASNNGVNGNRVETALQWTHTLPNGPVYVMLGINDLAAEKSVSEIISNYRTLLNLLKGRKITIQSVVGPERLPVQELNAALQDLALEMGAGYLDLTPALGYPLEYTYDGVHLTPDGYKIWAQILKADVSGARKASPAL